MSFSHFELLTDENEIYNLLSASPDAPNLISCFMAVFTNQLNISTLHLKDSWEKDLGIQITDEDWLESIKVINTCSINSRHQLIQYKVVHRLHYSRVKVNKFYPSISSTCNKCESAEGSLGHLFWFCLKLFEFWSEIFRFYSEAYSCDLSPDPEIAVFGWSDSLHGISHQIQKAAQYGMVVAKKKSSFVYGKRHQNHFLNLGSLSQVTLLVTLLASRPPGNPFLNIYQMSRITV